MKLSHLLAALPQYTLLSMQNSAPASPTATTDFEQIFTQDSSSIEITKITADSRQVEPGTLFVAYAGVKLDGHRFISDAITKGAAAIIGEDKKLFSNSLLPDPYFPPMISVPNGREALAYMLSARYSSRGNSWQNHDHQLSLPHLASHKQQGRDDQHGQCGHWG